MHRLTDDHVHAKLKFIFCSEPRTARASASPSARESATSSACSWEQGWWPVRPPSRRARGASPRSFVGSLSRSDLRRQEMRAGGLEILRRPFLSVRERARPPAARRCVWAGRVRPPLRRRGGAGLGRGCFGKRSPGAAPPPRCRAVRAAPLRMWPRNGSLRGYVPLCASALPQELISRERRERAVKNSGCIISL
jgi:hypothetical protein